MTHYRNTESWRTTYFKYGSIYGYPSQLDIIQYILMAFWICSVTTINNKSGKLKVAWTFPRHGGLTRTSRRTWGRAPLIEDINDTLQMISLHKTFTSKWAFGTRQAHTHMESEMASKVNWSAGEEMERLIGADLHDKRSWQLVSGLLVGH